MANELIAARLAVIAAKAKILSETYKNGQMWEGDLVRGLDEIEIEMNLIRRQESPGRGNPWHVDDR